MSNAVSVLNGATQEGSLQIADAGLKGMITLRGDLSDATFAKAVKTAVGLAVPAAWSVKSGAKGAVAWMSPDELLLICDYADADAMVAKLEKALQGTHALAVNVSDARAVFTVSGNAPERLLAKGTPTNLNDFNVGDFKRSRLGQVASAFWLTDENTLNIVCFRSVGAFMYDWLCQSARNAG